MHSFVVLPRLVLTFRRLLCAFVLFIAVPGLSPLKAIGPSTTQPNPVASTARPISELGDLEVIAVCNRGGGSIIEKHAVINGKRYPVTIDRPEVGTVTRRGVLLQGTLINGVLKLDSTSDQSSQANQSLRAAEIQTPATHPNLGTKRILVVRIDFDDMPGDPIDWNENVYTAPKCRQVMQESVNPFFVSSSFGQTSLQTTVTEELFRMPRSYSSYENANDYMGLKDDALAAAKAQYPIESYDRLCILFSYDWNKNPTKFYWAGLGELGGDTIWIHGFFDFGTVAHELGHNLGLNHAGHWTTTDLNPISETGHKDSTGDFFDLMSYNGDATEANDFNHCEKATAGWIQSAQMPAVTSSGTYRIHGFDYPDRKTSDVVALKISKDGNRTYWIGYRAAYTDKAQPPINQTGLYVLWETSTGTQLLDLSTPGGYGFSADHKRFNWDISDCFLQIGYAFTDPELGLTIEPISHGGSGSQQYIDVRITLNRAQPLLANPIDARTDEFSGPVNFTVTARNEDGLTYQWQSTNDHGATWFNIDDSIGFGAQTSRLSCPSLKRAEIERPLRCMVSSGEKSTISSTVLLRYGLPPSPLSFPHNTVAMAGTKASFEVAVRGTPPFKYSWSCYDASGECIWELADNRQFKGTKTAKLTIDASADLDGISVVPHISNDYGAAPIMPRTILYVRAGQTAPTRTINLSSRAFVAHGENVLITGFVIDGTTPKKVLLRAAGPALSDQGISAPLADPIMELHDSAGILASNDNWEDTNASEITEAAQKVGAFAFKPRSKDAALIANLLPGAYSVVIKGRNSGTGIGLAEIYDLDTATSSSKLMNVSTRSNLRQGEGTLIAGFVISGDTPKTVLIRASGPALLGLGVINAATDPSLELHDISKTLLSNDNWNDFRSGVIPITATKVGAFPWKDFSKDSAILTTLQPGPYSILVKGQVGDSGVALVEVYDAD